MYVCGITPYDATHLGHAFTYLTFDLVNRAWRDLGRAVRYVQNVTDVDDPLLERAEATGVDWRDLALGDIELFRDDMTALRVLAPDAYPAVSESMDLIEQALDHLRQRGEIYQVDDQPADWYFSFTGQPGFGQVSHLGPAAMRTVFAERGGDPDRPGKRHPLDALVWRLARPGEPSWPSSLGRGRPGWHIQCVAMAQAGLGPIIDLQGGGSDLAFPHHEMCAAEAQVLTGQPFARAFAHVGMVGLDGQKMSKSEGNLVKVSQLRAAGADPMAIRLALLAHHWRTDWSWTAADLVGGQARLELWRQACRGTTSVDFAPVASAVRAAVRLDLHADRALSALDVWAQASVAADQDCAGARAAMAELADRLLGVAVA
jgi:L-cysteine:1D-myo-inositol 2-amino-2-deoxy-alpha-D-glucopyranoside ligase